MIRAIIYAHAITAAVPDPRAPSTHHARRPSGQGSRAHLTRAREKVEKSKVARVPKSKKVARKSKVDGKSKSRKSGIFYKVGKVAKVETRASR